VGQPEEGVDLVVEFAQARLDGGEEEGFLRREVAVDGPLADAEPVGDDLDVGGGEPVAGERGGGGGEDLGPPPGFEPGVLRPARLAGEWGGAHGSLTADGRVN